MGTKKKKNEIVRVDEEEEDNKNERKETREMKEKQNPITTSILACLSFFFIQLETETN